METKLLLSTDILLKTFENEVNNCDMFYIVVSSVSSGDGTAPHWKIIEKNHHKLKQAIVGLQFHQTEPKVLFQLYEWYKLNLVYDTSGVFHPKFYLFEKGNSFSVIMGSSDFTVGGFFRNFENNVLLSGQKEESVYFELKGFYEHCKKRSRIPDILDLKQYEKDYNLSIPDYVSLSTYIADEQRKKILTRPGDNLPDYSWEHILQFTFEEYIHALKYLDKNNEADIFYKEMEDEEEDEDHNEYEDSEEYEDKEPLRGDTINAIDSYQKIIHKYKSLSQMPEEERKVFCGTIKSSDKYGWCIWLGSMTGAGYFKQMVIRSPYKLDQHLDKIPLVGDVAEDDLREYILGMLSMENIGVAISMRLLTAKRPDLFLSINKKNIDKIIENTKLTALKYNSQKKEEFIDAYIKLHKKIYSAPWFEFNGPTDGIERKVFLYRVALLDCFFYDPE